MSRALDDDFYAHQGRIEHVQGIVAALHFHLNSSGHIKWEHVQQELQAALRLTERNLARTKEDHPWCPDAESAMVGAARTGKP